MCNVLLVVTPHFLWAALWALCMVRCRLLRSSGARGEGVLGLSPQKWAARAHLMWEQQLDRWWWWW